MHQLTMPCKPYCIQLCTIIFEAEQLSVLQTSKLAILALIHYPNSPTLSISFTQLARPTDDIYYDDSFV